MINISVFILYKSPPPLISSQYLPLATSNFRYYLSSVAFSCHILKKTLSLHIIWKETPDIAAALDKILIYHELDYIDYRRVL